MSEHLLSVLAVAAQRGETLQRFESPFVFQTTRAIPSSHLISSHAVTVVQSNAFYSLSLLSQSVYTQPSC